MGRDSEKRAHNLTQSFTPNKALLLSPEDHYNSYVYLRPFNHYTNLGIPKLWDLWEYFSNCEQVSFQVNIDYLGHLERLNPSHLVLEDLDLIKIDATQYVNILFKN